MRYAKMLALFLFLMSIGVPNIQSQDNVETKKLTKIRQNDGMKMVYIPTGTFMIRGAATSSTTCAVRTATIIIPRTRTMATVFVVVPVED